MKYVSNNPSGCLIKECANGNDDAYKCAAAIYCYVDWLDNVIDKDIEVNFEASAKTSLNLFVMLSYNRFWLEHKSHLAPVLVTAYNAWIDSEKIKSNGDYRVRIAADVLKGYFLEVFYQIAFITGGYELMRSLSEKWRGFDFDAVQDNNKILVEMMDGPVLHDFKIQNISRNNKEWEFPSKPREFSFPWDHGSHDDYLMEWWYFSGILESEGKKYGYHFCEFRLDKKYFQHLSTVDMESGVFKFKEYNTDKSVFQVDASDRFSVKTPYLELTFKSDGKVLLQGNSGLSVKSDIPGHASYYYSIPKIRTSGSIGGLQLSGDSWFDHEWGSMLKPEGIKWAFFYAYFDSGAIINGYIMIRDGKVDTEHSRVTFISQSKEIGVQPVKVIASRPAPSISSPNIEIETDIGFITVYISSDWNMCKSSLGDYLELPCRVSISHCDNLTEGLGYVEISG